MRKQHLQRGKELRGKDGRGHLKWRGQENNSKMKLGKCNEAGLGLAGATAKLRIKWRRVLDGELGT